MERDTAFQSSSSSEMRGEVVDFLLSLHVGKCNSGVYRVCRVCSVTTQGPCFPLLPLPPTPTEPHNCDHVTQYYGAVVRVSVTHQPFLGSPLSTRLATGFFSAVPISISSGRDKWLIACAWSNPANCWDDDRCRCLNESFSPRHPSQSCKTCPLCTLPIAFLII